MTGDKELDRELAGLEPKLAKKLAKKGTRKVAKELVLPAARRNVPQGETKRLGRSLTVRVAKGKGGKRLPREMFGHAVTVNRKKFADVFYAGFVELGTKYQRPSRYLRDALHSSRGSARDVFRVALRDTVNEISKESKAKRPSARDFNRILREAGAF